MKTKILLSALLVFASVSAFADSYRQKATTEPGLHSYQMGSSGHYELKTNYLKKTLTISGDGVFAPLNGKVEEEIDTTVPGIDFNGHAYLELVQKDGSLFAVLDDETQDDDGNVTSSSKMGVEVKFAKGSMDSFNKGEQIELVLTDAAKKKMEADLRKGTDEGVAEAEEQMKASAAQLGFSKVTAKLHSLVMTDLAKVKVSGTKSKLDVVTMGADFDIEFIFTK